MSKGSRRRPMCISPHDYDHRFTDTFSQTERRLSNDPVERGNRLRQAASRRLRETVFPDTQTDVSRADD